MPWTRDKTYRFTATWGESRDSDDAEGTVTGTSAVRPTRAEIEAMLPRFTGTLTQVPPAYSAIKVEGERAYDLARDGEEVVLEPRPVRGVRGPAAGRPNRTGPSSKSVVAKALTSGPGCAISPWRWALWAMFRPCAGPGWAPGDEKDAVGAGYPDPFYA